MESTKIEVLHDHYKDSCSISKDAQASRNKMFLLVCFIVVAQFLLLVEPASIIFAFTLWIRESYDIDIGGQLETIQIFLWLMLLYCVMRYYQLSCYVERLHLYIHKLETQLSSISQLVIDRESKSYLDFYPKLLDGVHVVYTWVFPILFQVVIITKIVIEINNSYIGLSIIINCVMFLCCSILTILYFYFLHFEKKK